MRDTSRTRTKIAKGIYRDAHGYSMIARVGTDPHRLSSGEIRYPLNTPIEVIKADWYREKMRLTAELGKTDGAPVTRGTLAADVKTYVATTSLSRQRRAERDHQLQWWCDQRDVHGRRFGDQRRTALAIPDLRRALGGLSHTGAAASTVNKYRHALSHVFTMLDGKAAPNPMHEVSKYAEPEPAARDVPYWAIRMIVEGIRDRGQGKALSRSKAIAHVLAYCPITPAQLRRLARADVDLEGGYFTVPGRRKGRGTAARRKRLIGCGLKAMRAFDAAGCWGVQFSRSSLYRVIIAARDRVVAQLRLERPDLDLTRIAHLRPYDFRHSYATVAYQATGGDRLLTAELLDHADPRTTRRYAQSAIAAHMVTASEAVAAAVDSTSERPTAPRLHVVQPRHARKAGQS